MNCKGVQSIRYFELVERNLTHQSCQKGNLESTFSIPT